MLLITRGAEPKNRDEVYKSFIENFIDANLVGSEFRDVVNAGLNNDFDFILKNEKIIIKMADEVLSLYENMDDSLQFKKSSNGTGVIQAENRKNITVKDFRGVACPMNFVKTKIELSKIKKGDFLEIYLDEGDPINNVPGSVKEEGHEIIEIKKIENYYSVVIKKG